MTVEKGQPWGKPGSRPGTAPLASSEAELAALAAISAAAGEQLIAGLAVGGDLTSTLGLVAERAPESQLRYPLDLGYASLDDGPPMPFVAHLVARRPLWAGQFAVVMNVAFVGEMYLGPRAHPNDGLLDVTQGRLSLRQRLLARSRVKTGTHLPHPELQMTRSAAWTGALERATPVFLDGVFVGRAKRIRTWIAPDSLILVV